MSTSGGGRCPRSTATSRLPGAVDELLIRIERLEHRVKVLEDAARAFAVVYAIPRVADKPGGNE